jgi:D-hydroxyproline dehydrogenase subunit gamma
MDKTAGVPQDRNPSATIPATLFHPEPLFRRLEAPQAHPTVILEVEGRSVAARLGDSVAVALLAAGLSHTRRSSISGTPRAPWCLMGTCFECLVNIDGVPDRQACMTPVREGMRVRRQLDPGAGEGEPGTLDPWGLDG